LQNPLATPALAVFGLAVSQRQEIMAKKSKIEPAKKITDTAEANSAAGNGSPVAAPRKKPRSTLVKSKAKKTAAKKAPASASRGPTKKSASAPAVREPTDEEIRIRAYFLAERRLQLSLPGDSAHDWIEARRQLIEEAGPASS
jgi:hypothetical protein